MRGGDGVEHQCRADIVLAGLDDAGDRDDAGAGRVAGTAVQRRGGEVDAVLAAAAGRAIVRRKLAVAGRLDQVAERGIQRRFVDAVGGNADRAGNADRHRRVAADVSGSRGGDLVDDDGAGAAVSGRDPAGGRSRGNHARIVSQHGDGVVIADRSAADVGVDGVASGRIGNRCVSHGDADTRVAAGQIQRPAADRDVAGLVGIDFDGTRTAGYARKGRVRDIGCRAIGDEAGRARYRGRIGVGRSDRDADDGLMSAVQRLHRHALLIVDGGVGDVGQRRVARDSDRDGATDRHAPRAGGAREIDRGRAGAVVKNGIVERLDTRRCGGRRRREAIDRRALNVCAGSQRHIGHR